MSSSPTGQASSQRSSLLKRPRGTPSPGVNKKKGKQNEQEAERRDWNDYPMDDGEDDHGSLSEEVGSEGEGSDLSPREIDTLEDSEYSSLLELSEELENTISDCINNKRYLSNGVSAKLRETMGRIKNQYMKLLEENRLLRIKLEKVAQQSTDGRSPMTYKDALYANQGHLSLGTVKAGRVLKPPKQNQIKTLVIKPNDLPHEEERRKESLAQLKDSIDRKLCNFRIDRIVRRRDDIIVRAPLNQVDMTTVLGELGSIDGIQARPQSRLSPEVLIYKDEFVGEKEDLKAQAKSLQRELNVDEWVFMRTTKKFFIIRVPAGDRSCMIRDGLYVRNMKLKVKDHLSLNVCYDCGQCHSRNKPCAAKSDEGKACCCLCGDKHHMGRCSKRGSRLDLSACKCSLCKKAGHNAMFGDMCDEKLKQLRQKLAMTDYGGSDVPYNGKLFDLVCS